MPRGGHHQSITLAVAGVRTPWGCERPAVALATTPGIGVASEHAIGGQPRGRRMEGAIGMPIVTKSGGGRPPPRHRWVSGSRGTAGGEAASTGSATRLPVKHSAQICQETGKEQEVQVLYDEGLANHIGPEPCGGLREEADEKSVGGHVGGV